MKDSKNSDGVSLMDVGNYMQAAEDQFASPFQPPWTPNARMLHKHLDASNDLNDRLNRCVQVVAANISRD